MHRIAFPTLATLAAAIFFASPTLAETMAAGGNGNPAPASSVQIGSRDASGNLQPASPSNPVPVAFGSAAPNGATQLTCASGNQANASAVCTLAGTTGKTTYITGFRCDGTGATGALLVAITVAGIVTGTQSYTFGFPVGVGVLATSVGREFSTAIPASATNTAIVVTLPAGGSGNLHATCNAEGYQQ